MIISDKNIITHDFPAWRDKSNFIIGAILGDDISDVADSEQIWAKRDGENIFEVCCIPFFVYGLALGFKVSTHQFDNKKYVVDKIIEKSSHVTYRVHFQATDRWSEVVDEIGLLGCLVEPRWNKSSLIAIDSPNDEVTAKLEKYFRKLVEDENIIFENGM